MLTVRSVFGLFAAAGIAGCGPSDEDVAKKSGKELAQSIQQSDTYKRAVDERLALMAKEENVLEAAAWIGKTGLPESVEREVPRYLRREFGESLSDAKSLRAADLVYIGAFHEGAALVHYWRVPYGKEEVYAYVVDSAGGSSIGWGGRKPKK